MDSPEQFERLATFVFRYFDTNQKGFVPRMHLGNMLRSLGQVWSFSELMEVSSKHGDRDVSLSAFQTLARNKRQAEHRALFPKEKSKGASKETCTVPGLSEKELKELKVCFSLMDPEDTRVCSAKDLTHILTCLGEPLSHADMHSLLVLERLEGREFLNFNEFCRLCARI